MKCKFCQLEIKLIGENYYAKRFNPDLGHVCTSNDSGKHEPSEPEVEFGCPHGCTNLQVAKQCPVQVVEIATTQATEPQKVCMCARTCLGEIKDCPRAGSTRPEMPPAEQPIKLDPPTLRSILLWCGAQDPDEEFLQVGLKSMLSRWAASVQQEPLRYPLKLNQPQLSTIDEWVNDPKNLFGDREARAINLPIFARQMLSCQPAAPRTQGREPLDEEVAQEFRAATNEDKGNNG